MELPAMSEALLEDKHQSDWEPVVNLDIFFSGMYTYFYHRGLYPLLITQVCAVLSLGFTVSFSVFLIAYVDWTELMNCHDEYSCQDISFYINRRPFFQNTFGFICLIYLLLFSAYWVWRCISAVQVIAQAINMERFYREKLGISQSELEILRWDEVLERLIRLHEQGEYRVAVSDVLTEHDVVSRILRKENYMVALINKAVLNLRLPWWVDQLLGPVPAFGPGPGNGIRGVIDRPNHAHSLFLTKSLEWSLYFCILQYMFDDQFTVSSQFLRDVPGLQKRFMVVGALHVLLLPFLVFFMVIHFFLQNAQLFHSSRAYLGPRQWSPLALWMFREFNELPHIFEQRMNSSLEPSTAYLNSFHNVTAAAIARFVVYISGSVVAVILLCSLMGDGILLYVRFGDYNLLWLLGLFSAVLAGARSLIPEDSQRQVSQQELMEKVAACTHHMPPRWMNRANAHEVKHEFAELFPFKARLFAMEVLSVFLTPLVLLFSLPDCAPAILQFLKDHTLYVEGLGSVCDYSRFNLGQYGDVKYGATSPGALPDRNKLVGPKLEQSMLNFSLHHPNWLAHQSSGGDVGQGGQQFLSRIHAYKDQMRLRRNAMLSSVLLQQSLVPQSRPLSFEPEHSYETESTHHHGQVKQANAESVNKSISDLEPRSGSAFRLSDSSTARPGPDQLSKSHLTSSDIHKATESRNVSSDSTEGQLLSMTEELRPTVGPPSLSPSSPPLPLDTEPTAELAPGRLEASFTLGSPLSPGATSMPMSTPATTDIPFKYRNPHRMQGHGVGVGFHRDTASSMSGRPHIVYKGLSSGGGMYSTIGDSLAGFTGGLSLGDSSQSSRYLNIASSGDVSGPNVGVPSVLRSVLRDEDIDFENDFYWLMKFQQDRARDPKALEDSLSVSSALRDTQSQLLQSSLPLPHSHT